MKMADWRACEAPSDEIREQLVWLYESPDGVSIYIHRSGQYALIEAPIGGGWDWSFARINRRDITYDRREADPNEPVAFDDRRTERRDPELDWTQFIGTYGNGEAG